MLTIHFEALEPTEITLSENLVSIGDYGFDDCGSLNKIIINTNSFDEVERIKNILPEKYRDKVIQNPIDNEVLGRVDNSFWSEGDDWL